MNLNPANKAIWLWLLERGGHWTAEDIARRMGYAPQNVFRAVFDMSRRKLIEQLDPIPGERKKRYGISAGCLVPLGLTVGEVTDPGKGVHETAGPITAAARTSVSSLERIDFGLSPAELRYLNGTPLEHQESRA